MTVEIILTNDNFKILKNDAPSDGLLIIFLMASNCILPITQICVRGSMQFEAVAKMINKPSWLEYIPGPSNRVSIWSC